MNEKAVKAYKTYQSCVKQFRTLKRVTKQDLNTLYNVSCRMRRDEEYRTAMKDIRAELCDEFDLLIEKFFEEYNNSYGLEIRDDLVEFENTELASGSYFVIKSYLKDDTGALIELAPTDFVVNQTAYVNATLYSHESNLPISVNKISLLGVSDEGTEFKKTFTDCASIDFSFTLRSPGYVKFKVKALNENGDEILGSEKAYGGIIFSRESIKTFHEPPRDLYDFWDGEIRRLMNTNPCENFADSYTGSVETLYDMPSKNKFSLKKLDADYIARLKANKQPCPTENELSEYGIYELMLKTPGPCPSSGYVAVPNGAKENSLPIFVSYDGYSVRSPAPIMKPDCIAVHCSHHGYELGHENDVYYAKIRETVGKSYCRGDGEINSRFDDIHDCYPLYVMLRDLQMIRFLIDENLSHGIESLHRVWNGEIVLWGSSMGGYQTIGVGALMSIMKKYCAPVKNLFLQAGSPAFADVAGHTAGRVKSTVFTYSEGADYFDTAILASLIDSKTLIFRASLGDEICTASSMSAIYNMIPSGVAKEIKYVQNSSHGYLPDEEHQMWFTYSNFR